MDELFNALFLRLLLFIIFFKRKSASTDEVKLLTIAALNICYELQTKKFEANDEQNALTERMEQLTTSLSDVLSKVKHGQQ
jgi:cell division protein ZapA (FtsZ GTPase activity inhibitor)